MADSSRIEELAGDESMIQIIEEIGEFGVILIVSLIFMNGNYFEVLNFSPVAILQYPDIGYIWVFIAFSSNMVLMEPKKPNLLLPSAWETFL